MTLETHITNNIEEIGEVAWNAFSAGQPFRSYNWYRFGEKVMANAKPIYVTLCENGQVIARASFWRTEKDATVQGLMAAFIQRWPLLMCRCPLFTAPGWIIPSNPLRADVLEELIRVGRQLRRQGKCSLLVFDGLDPATARLIPHSIKYSFNMPTNVINNPQWENFDQYLTSLKYSERNSIKRNLRKVEELGIVITRHQTVSDIDQAERLYRTFEARKGSMREPWLRRMLENISMVNATWITARDASGELVGWILEFEDNGAQALCHVARNSTEYVYFGLIYEGLRLGLERGVHTLYWGVEAYSLKKRLGFSTYDNDSIAITL